jgi:phage terminase small subunit
VFLGGGPAENAEDPEAAAAIDSVPDELEEAAEVNFTEKAQAYFGNYFIKEGVSILLQEFNDAPVLLDSLLITYLQSEM